MIPELGHFSLLLAAGLCILLAVLPALGVRTRIPVLMLSGLPLAAGILVFILLSFMCLLYAFVSDDFSVRYVANNSNTALPRHYKIAAIWGGHEGSFLLWTLIMAIWTFAVACFSRSLTVDMRARVLSVLGLLTLGFTCFLLFTSNPFARILPIFPQDGADLNPLLQDFGLIVHPPLLYIGYVGFAVPFAFAIATLTTGRLDAAWVRWSRPWTNVAWAFLSLGITLGSWWAYYELGWGGWWFWDAVENASFMPWLAGTALIHSLAVSDKRGLFKSWTVLLAIITFSLSLLGAFLVRSGVLTSVHAFAVDPARGIYILIFLVLVVGGSLLLYASKVSSTQRTSADSRASYSWASREVLLLVNNLLLSVAVAAILLGTLYPLAYEVITDGGKISVGPPYFNTVFLPILVLLFLAMVFGPLSRWRATRMKPVLRELMPFLAVALLMVAGLTWVLGLPFEPLGFVFQSIGVWLLLTLINDGWQSIMLKKAVTASRIGMLLAHGGIGVAILGVAVTVGFSEGRDLRMVPGDVVSIQGYDFRFDEMTRVAGPNYMADRAQFSVSVDGEAVTRLYPEKRFYPASGHVMTEADMHPSPLRDLYVALGESLSTSKVDDGASVASGSASEISDSASKENAWAVRLHVKPFVRWIWFGGLMIAAGGLIAICDRRYRHFASSRQTTVTK